MCICKFQLSSSRALCLCNHPPKKSIRRNMQICKYAKKMQMLFTNFHKTFMKLRIMQKSANDLWQFHEFEVEAHHHSAIKHSVLVKTHVG